MKKLLMIFIVLSLGGCASFGRGVAEAILEKPEISCDEVAFLTVNEEAKTLFYKMTKDDHIYGLGEHVRGINKRGWFYESKCRDEPNHKEDTCALYGAHNFLVVDGEEQFGIFIDYPGIVSFDVGYTRSNDLTITLSDWNFDLYVITGESLKDIVKQFRQLIGKSYIAPLWGLGHGQSRWGYVCADDIREVVKRYKELELPLDSVYMDIDYMDHLKDFTIHPERFPEFPKFAEEMKAQNIRLVPIIDAGVKIEEGYPIYEEGAKKGYFCKNADGTIFVGAVWPGKCAFPDMLNKDAREWFGNNYKILLDQGVEGFWNDMNEPSIFYAEEHLQEIQKHADSYEGNQLMIDHYWTYKSMFDGMSNNEEDYKRFYHNIDGQMVRHDKVHNLFGYNMTRAAGEAFERLCPDKRILIFSRASYIGMHRYGGIWQGDNRSWWSHLLMNLQMMPSLNMCGFLYTGADLGGFGSNTTEDLMLRWMALGIYTPLMRNHSCIDSRRQEPYLFEDIDGFRHILGMRYKLLPYLYSEYMKAALDDEMMFRPLAFEYPNDPLAARVEDQLMVGDGMMIAPVYVQNAPGRYVYLPETMKMVRFKKDGTVDEEIMEKGHYYVEIDLTDVVFFVRENHIIPMSKGGLRVEDVDFEHVELLSCVTAEEATYEYYHDDGLSKDYENPANRTVLRVKK